MLSQHKLDVGTHGAEDFFHLVVLVFVNHDIGLCLGSLTGNGHVGKNGQFGKASHVVVTFNLIAEEREQEEHQCGNGKSKEQGDEHNHRRLRTNLASSSGLINELTLVGSGSKLDGVLLTFLQQHQVKTRLHVLLTTNLGKHALLFWSCTHLSGVLAVL